MPLVDFSLDGKVAVITGGSRGIGRSIATGLAEQGASVVLAARNLNSLEDAASSITKNGGRVLTVQTNVRHIEDLKHLVDCCINNFGRLDVLVNNAGTNPVFGPIHEVDERAWDAIMNTNVRSIHFLSTFAREVMIKQESGGSIINVSSLGGFQASDVIGAYSISKAALNMVTQVCAKTWGKDKIRVNCIAPGLVKTEFARALWDNETILKEIVDSSALRRIGTPNEMVGVAVFLASDASSFLTGQTIIIDGGRRL